MAGNLRTASRSSVSQQAEPDSDSARNVFKILASTLNICVDIRRVGAHSCATCPVLFPVCLPSRPSPVLFLLFIITTTTTFLPPSETLVNPSSRYPSSVVSVPVTRLEVPVFSPPYSSQIDRLGSCATEVPAHRAWVGEPTLSLLFDLPNVGYRLLRSSDAPTVTSLLYEL
ncbi:hypothetical protein MAP00_009185 [Monascus purpureus]|nr:hypothetical protein MAP00_009185 [Monascus purpureus]